jgi:hypothetical protein
MDSGNAFLAAAVVIFAIAAGVVVYAIRRLADHPTRIAAVIIALTGLVGAMPHLFDELHAPTRHTITPPATGTPSEAFR